MLAAGFISIVSAYLVFLSLIYLGIHYQLASIANFTVYLIISFTLNRVWAFKSSGSLRLQATAHMGLHVGNQIMIMAGLFVLVELVGLMPAWSQLIMQVFTTLTVFIITPLIFKK